jgi:hypothetical protein
MISPRNGGRQSGVFRAFAAPLRTGDPVQDSGLAGFMPAVRALAREKRGTYRNDSRKPAASQIGTKGRDKQHSTDFMPNLSCARSKPAQHKGMSTADASPPDIPARSVISKKDRRRNIRHPPNG